MQVIMVTLVRAVRILNMQNYSGSKRKNIEGHNALLLLQ
jgi:hypothetical protein